MIFLRVAALLWLAFAFGLMFHVMGCTVLQSVSIVGVMSLTLAAILVLVSC